MAKKIDILQGQTGQIPFKAFYEGVSRPDLTTNNIESPSVQYTYVEHPDGTIYKGSVVFKIKS
ncbi:hypothetical protein N1M2_159 [Klebsiella phage N1M2]|uniref:Uncharacterized protein n=1 Tax=Klebsiella phage N1M2 TaxID=2664939 RepID=A0A6B7ZF72_9CAUD|nr:hypothetical protein PQB72_gp159 [Klebsiella phage N1M2]QGH72022.1 hypothetical protein N1M2_159 [Klebsiella phage N1M2]